MNQEVLSYLRAIISYAQLQWPLMLPIAMLALNNRDIAIGLGPFFLTHGYHADPIDQVPAKKTKASGPTKRAHNFIKRRRERQEYAQAAMASI
ncbi:hypothetical protein K3495_g8209 [Podosphaera aphanis]|nr:hypothetical protein K3495_g8209 [Podosphaera aphanis]